MSIVFHCWKECVVLLFVKLAEIHFLVLATAVEWHGEVGMESSGTAEKI